MGNELVNEAKDCCNEGNEQQDSGMSFLSIVESAGKSVGNAIRSAEEFGAGVVSGAANGVGIDISQKTAENIAKGAVAAGLGVAGVVAVEQAVRNPGVAAGAVAGAAVGIGALEAVKAIKDANGNCATDCARDMAIGAAIGAAAGLATGDATRAATLAALGAITGCAARCAADCGPCCIKPADAVGVAKDLGKAVLEHVKNHPAEAAAEGVLAGPAGVLGGAMIRQMLEKDGCCEKLGEKVMKKTCEEIKKHADMIKKLFDPFKMPLIEMGPQVGTGVRPEMVKAGVEVAKAGVEAAIPVIGPVATEAAKIGAEAAKQTQKELEQHRKDNPTTSQVERAIGKVAGGVLAGDAVGTAIEIGDIKARQAYQWVKSWFE